MRISKVIEKLRLIGEKHGDLHVFIEDNGVALDFPAVHTIVSGERIFLVNNSEIDKALVFEITSLFTLHK